MIGEALSHVPVLIVLMMGGGSRGLGLVKRRLFAL